MGISNSTSETQKIVDMVHSATDEPAARTLGLSSARSASLISTMDATTGLPIAEGVPPEVEAETRETIQGGKYLFPPKSGLISPTVLAVLAMY